jgi:hypothetical protein
MDNLTLELWSLDLYIIGAIWELQTKNITIKEWNEIALQKDKMDGVYFRLVNKHKTIVGEIKIERKHNLSNSEF